MDKIASKKIAETITNEQLEKMLKTAKELITNWNVVSICYKGLSKGIAWNILARYFDVNEEDSLLFKTNMVREFGFFLPVDLKPVKKKTKVSIKFSHIEPIFKSDE